MSSKKTSTRADARMMGDGGNEMGKMSSALCSNVQYVAGTSQIS